MISTKTIQYSILSLKNSIDKFQTQNKGANKVTKYSNGANGGWNLGVDSLHIDGLKLFLFFLVV